MRYQIKKVDYEDIDINDDQLISLKEAAEQLEMTLPGLISAINRGQFTEIIDSNAKTNYSRRFLLRSEVAEAIADRK
jgi:hypothetical protein